MLPKTPPFVMVKVPPAISSRVILPSRALLAKSARANSRWWKFISWQLRMTGTTSPVGVETAVEMSMKSLYTISLLSITALTTGYSLRAWTDAFIKADINPSLTPCFFVNASYIFVRKSMNADMSISLKVVRLALVF